MALIPVTLSEVLRPWRNAGVFHFLQDAELLSGMEQEAYASLYKELHPQAGSAPQPVGLGVQKVANMGGRTNTTQQTTPVARPVLVVKEDGVLGQPLAGSESGNEHTSVVAQGVARGKTSAGITAQPSEQPAIQEAESSVLLELSVEKWPAAWQQAFARAVPAPVLWTYPELADDLGGKANPQRSACLRSIIGALKLPKGTNTFWSPMVLTENGNETDPCYFLSGLQLLAPKMIIAIGEESLASFVGIASLSVPFTQQLYKGMLVVLLPDFSLLMDRSDLVDKSIIYLRACFSHIPSLQMR